MVVTILSDYIVDIETRNKLDEARHQLALSSRDNSNEGDRTLYVLALRAGNSLSKAILALPGLDLTDDDPTEVALPADDADATGDVVPGVDTDAIQEQIEGALGGFGAGGD